MTKLSVFKDKKIFITGHSGFKGSWLALWLDMLGAQVVGYSDFNSNFEHHALVNFPGGIEKHDIRNRNALRQKLEESNPDIIFHLAAQPLVSVGYQEPLNTWDINLNGTANVLYCAELIPNLKGIVVITSDKVYLDDGYAKRHKESDPLGGHDSYSASKAGVELLVSSYLNSYRNQTQSNAPSIITARAGNVIGGGDFSRDRLFPDIFQALNSNQMIQLRMPNAVRPWQHVLDCTFGYLKIAELLLERKKTNFGSYNFGPIEREPLTVSEILSLVEKITPINYKNLNEKDEISFVERKALEVDSSRAEKDLGWRPMLSQEQAVKWTTEWYLKYKVEKTACTKEQIEKYTFLLMKNGG